MSLFRPSLNIHEWGDNATERGRTSTAMAPLSPRTRMHLGLSSSLHFTLSCPQLFCRRAVELYYGHLWIGSQLIYSQRVTGETSDMLFRFATNNNSSNDGRDDGGAAHVSQGFSSLLKPVKTHQLFAFPSRLRITYLQSHPTRKTEPHVLQGDFL